MDAFAHEPQAESSRCRFSVPQSHCHYRAIAKFGDEAVGFDSEDSSTGGYYNGTSSYWVNEADPGGNVGFYFERVQELQTLHWQYTTSQSYWDKQDSSHNCEAEGRPYEPELFYKYHYQLLLPYLASGTALYDGYPFATGCVRCVIDTQPIKEKLPQLALSAAAAAATILLLRQRSSTDAPSPPPPLAPPPWDHSVCSTPCGDGDCASLAVSFSCEALSTFGCNCAGCCTAASPSPRPPAPPPQPLPPLPLPPTPSPNVCTNPCGSSDCETMGTSFTCLELDVFGCDCNGCNGC